MLTRTYKDLKFWQTSREVCSLVIAICRKLPNERIAWVITDQLLRSSFSVSANIAEGFGKFKGKEYKRFLSMALGSANETEFWLELLAESFPKLMDNIDSALRKNLESIKMLASAVKSLSNRP